MRPINTKWYGWQPDLPDFRDLHYDYNLMLPVSQPEAVDLRPKCPPVFDQGELGSCTANAISAAFLFEMMRQNKPNLYVPSRLFIYYNERLIEGTVNEDSGAQLRDGIKSVVKQGICPEPMWPYDISQYAVKPPQHCYQYAQGEQVLKYRRVSGTLTAMLSCLASGFPFVFGFTVYESFESDEVARTGILKMPSPYEQVLGGHAVMAVGYNRTTQNFIVRNSWGADWGQDGYFLMPFDYLINGNLSDDRWVISKVE